MKLTAIFLFVSCLMAGMKGTAQTVTLSVKNAKLETVLNQFKKQTGYSFFYDELIFTKSPKVNLELNKTPLKEALELCFNQQPDLLFKFFGNTVVISKKITAPVEDANEPGQTIVRSSGIEVNGVVYNKRRETLANASVMVRGSQKGTLTRADGSFKLEGLEPEAVLRISFIGYRPVDIAIKDNPQLQIVLEENTNELDQVVAQGYSNTTKRLSTSTINKVTSEEINRKPVLNPLLSLQGRVPGLSITPESGYAAGPINLQVRGRGLLSYSNSTPLILIDGIQLNTDGPVQGILGYESPAKSQSSLFGFNPNDIESIEVLQDLGATAIYGSSGANGVILITTKKGKAGGAVLNIGINKTIKKITRYWKLLNTEQYLEMRREAFKNDAMIPTPQNAPDLLVWDTTRNTDWQKEMWGDVGQSTSVNVSLSGGSGQFNQRISAYYNYDKDIAVSNGTQSMGVSVSLDAKSNNKKFVASLTANYYSSNANMTKFPNVAMLPPNAPPLLDDKGGINFEEWSPYESGLGLHSLLTPVKSVSHAVNSSLNLSYQLAKGLKLQTLIGYYSSLNTINSKYPIAVQNPLNHRTGILSIGKSNQGSLTIDPQLHYSTWLFGQGKLDIDVGATYKSAKSENLTIRGNGYTNDAQLKSISSAPFLESYDMALTLKSIGAFANLDYVWNNKYVMRITGRRDGSSRFGPGNRFGNFGSVGLAWVASDEPWLQKKIQPLVGFLKFHFNTGIAGSDAVGDYKYLTRWGRQNAIPNYDNITPYISMQAVNPNYHWQVAKELNLGMDVSFFKDDKLQLSISYFRKRIGNQLLELPTPYFTGFPSVTGNAKAEVENKGWSFSVNAKLISGEKFSWSASFNGGFIKNTLLSYPDIEYTSDFYSMVPGRSLNEWYLLNYQGVNPLTGNYQFQDYNHDGMLSGVYDPTYPLSGTNDMGRVIDIAPKFLGGMGHDFNFWNFSLHLMFDIKIGYGYNAYTSISNPGSMGNIPVELFNNRWQKPGDNAMYSKFSILNNQKFYRDFSNLAFTDASFIRLNSLSLAYPFPQTWLKKWKLKGSSFSITASNLFIITRYKGIDPETTRFDGMPPVRIISAALSITL